MLGGLLAALLWAGRRALDVATLFRHLDPTLQQRLAQAVPTVPPSVLSIAALFVYAGICLLAALALIRTLATWSCAASNGRRAWPALAWRLAAPAGILGVLVGSWWWLTTPAVVETVPPAGAENVPRDTVVRVAVREKRWPRLMFDGFGAGMSVRYRDRPYEYIPGISSGGGTTYSFAPREPLQPNATIEVTVRRTGLCW